MKFRIKHLFAAVTIVACVCLAVGFFYRATKARTIVSKDLANGTRVRVIQTYPGVLFNTSIYFDDGDGNWRWYYYDHEDVYWNHANTLYDNGILYITSGDRYIFLNTVSGKCEIGGSQIGKTSFPKSDNFVDLPTKTKNPR